MMLRTSLLLLINWQVFAQIQLPLPSNYRNSYSSQVRSWSGLPGKNYWQNRADYSIRIQFSPDTRRVSGQVDIDYVNNSPDTLSKMVFKLYPNLYKTESIRTKPISKEDLGNGVEVDSILMDGQPVNSKVIAVRGTNMTVKGVSVLPQTRARIQIKYSYILNRGSFIRTGQVDDGAFVVAYFFPRVAVYDDIDGWNEYPYTGFDEFYNDYGNFHTEITVPDYYQVWCTGNLVNAGDVFNQKYLQLIEKAGETDSVVHIITEKDLAAKSISKKRSLNTWIFEAGDVVDVAFMTSNHYVWKSSSVLVDSTTKRRVRVDAVYNPAHTQYNPVIDYARSTVHAISHTFPKIAFPYPHITIFEGLDAMEYPMMVNNLPFKEPQEIVELTAHEIFHTLLPFYVGTNETKYSFLDEGLATLSEFTLHPVIAPQVPMSYSIEDVNQTAGADYDNPIITLTPQLNSKSRFSNKDLKPALGFYYVKEMLGDELFSKAWRYFIDNWKGKHPTPYDFFHCFNEGAGVNLNWFWKDWFINKVAPDLAITKVSRHKAYYEIEVRKMGAGSVPVHLDITFSDDTHAQISADIRCWSKGEEVVTLQLKSAKKIRQVKLGSNFDADIDKSNNVWPSRNESK